MSGQRPNLNRLPLTPGWMDQADCVSVDPDLWYPAERGGAGMEAKLICRRCPVKPECLDYALRYREAHGIWGGLGPEERANLLRR